MANSKNNQLANSNNGPEIIDGQIIDITPQLSSPGRGSGVQLAPRNAMRSNVQDGGWFDATSGKRKPIFVITPTTDPWSIFPVIRSGLSCLRNHPLQTMGGAFISVWGGLFVLSAGLNVLQGSAVKAGGDIWNPVVAGTNFGAMLVVPTQSIAGSAHKVLTGEERVGQPIEIRPYTRAVKVGE
jgi:hypothetical protein